MDKDEAIKSNVEEKLQDKLGRGFIRDKISASAGINKSTIFYYIDFFHSESRSSEYFRREDRREDGN